MKRNPYHKMTVPKLMTLMALLILSWQSHGQKFKMNNIYYDVDDAFPNATFVSVNSKDPLQSMYGLINLETVETIGRYTYKAKSEEDDFQDATLPFMLKDLRNGQLHLAWTVKQIEKEKHRKLVKVDVPKNATLPDYVHPNIDHAKVFLIFKSSSTVTLNAKESVIPVVKNGIFTPQVFELKIYEEGKLDMNINQSSNNKSLNIFFGDEHYLLVDYRKTISYLDVYPEYMGKLMVSSFDAKPIEVRGLNLQATAQHNIVNEIRKLDEVIVHLRDSARSASEQYVLNDKNWSYLGSQGKEGKAHGVGDAISKDGSQFIMSGYFEQGEFKSGVIETIFGEKRMGNFENYALTGKGYHLLREGTIFNGTFVNGQLQGVGKMINIDGIVYEGSFKDYLLDGAGKVTVPNGDFYDGNFQKGLAHGAGTFDTNSKIEKCEYYRGVRSDQTFMTVTENKRNEHFRKMAPLETKKKLRYLNTYSRRRTANQLFKQMAHVNGTSQAHNKIGIDAQSALNALPRNFPGVISSVTDDLLRVNNQWVNDRGFMYIENQPLQINSPLQNRPKEYREEYEQAQIFMEGIQKKNAELNDASAEKEPEEMEKAPSDDWSWDEETPIAPVAVAKDVWISGYFSHKEEGCQVWKWSDYSVLLKVCSADNAHVSFQNKDYDPIKVSYKVQFKNGNSSMSWDADLLPDTNTKENCINCDPRKSGVRAVYLKDLIVQVD